MRSAIKNQVEFDIPSSPVFLEFLLTGVIGGVFSFVENLEIRVAEGFSYLDCEVQGGIESSFRIIVEKDSSHASGFLSVAEVKILITPLLEMRILVLPNLITSLFSRSVPIDDIFFNRVVGTGTEPSTKPPYPLLVRR